MGCKEKEVGEKRTRRRGRGMSLFGKFCCQVLKIHSPRPHHKIHDKNHICGTIRCKYCNFEGWVDYHGKFVKDPGWEKEFTMSADGQPFMNESDKEQYEKQQEQRLKIGSMICGMLNKLYERDDIVSFPGSNSNVVLFNPGTKEHIEIPIDFDAIEKKINKQKGV